MYKLDIELTEVSRVSIVEGISRVYSNLRIKNPNSPWGYQDVIIPGDTVELRDGIYKITPDGLERL
jgi:hypothetical protein